ncbi:MAG: cyclase family protein [Clostridiaceae bacterium]|nr:cyclase family protein [Clostridiaceae bacterium]
MFEDYKIIDLSVTLTNDAVSEVRPSKIKWITHDTDEGKALFINKLGCDPKVLPSGGHGNAVEIVTAGTHTGTHLDAPWHYAPTSEGKPAKTIEEIPLEWCFSDGVVLDFRHLPDGHVITVDELKAELNRIDYKIKPFDIVLIMTGCDKRINSPDYFKQPGMGREGVLWLVDQGVKVMGIDAWGFDTSFDAMRREYERTGDGSKLWQAHFAGKEREYCHIEKLANLDLLPPHGFKVICFPIKIEKASAGWCRAVALVKKS